MRRRLRDSPSRARARRTAAAIERGELPPDLVARIRRGGPATSALSVADVLALRSLGAEPLALVSGASVIRRLHQPMLSPTPRRAPQQGVLQELRVRSDALNAARSRALRRLREEAALAGADAVVGIRLRRAEREHREDELNLVEVVATGTAVWMPGTPRLVLTTLGGADLATLARSGWHPLDLVASSTVWYVASGRQTIDQFGLTWAQGGTNSEAGDYTRVVYAARSRAIGRLETGAHSAGAGGIVDLTWEQSVRRVKREGFGVNDLEVTLHVAGTAIAGRDREIVGATVAVSVA